MKEFLKKNFLILLAFLLPIALIVVVVLVTYLPSLFLSTNYNFLYSSCGNAGYYPYGCYNYIKDVYSIKDGKLVVSRVDFDKNSKEDDIADSDKNYTARLFLYDTEKNESSEITLKEAQEMTFSELLTSPDGVTVSGSYDRSHGFFLFDGGGSYGFYLTKGDRKRKLNLISAYDSNYSLSNFRFIGWVLY